MATEDQLNNQRELNKALGDYTSGLTDASDFISILSSRSSELVDQYRALGRLAKGDFTDGNKQALSAIQQVAKAARDMQNPYENIKALQKDIEKGERNRRQLINSIGAESQKLSTREIKGLKDIEAQRNKILQKEQKQQVLEDKIGKKKVKEAEDFLDLQNRIKEQQEFITQLEPGSDASKEAQKTLATLEAQERVKEKTIKGNVAAFVELEKELSTERDKLEVNEENLSIQQRLLLTLKEGLVAQEKGLQYLEDQEDRLKRIARAQSLYENTLGFTGKALKRLGFESSKLQEAIDAGSERANDLAKQLTKGGQEAVGLGGKLRIFFGGLGKFIANIGVELAAVLGVVALKKLIINPLIGAFKAVMAPARKVIGEITGFFKQGLSFIMDSFFSIQGFVDSFKEGEQLIFTLDQATADIATNLGIGTEEARGLFDQANRIGNKLAMLPEEVLKLTESLNQAFGTTQRFSDETVETFGVLVTRLGLTNEEASNFVKLQQLSGETAENFTEETQLQIRALKAKNNVAISETAIMKEVANASAAIQLSSRGHGTNLVEAAINAKKLGLELSKVEDIGSNLLDFESSIAKEMEAELLIGRDLNLDRARQAALTNNLGVVASEVSRQVGSAAEFGRMSVIQQEALAAAVGMTRNELGETLKTQELLAGTGFEDMNSAQQEYLELVEKTGSEEKAMAVMRERGSSKALVDQVRRASAQELENKRQRALAAAQMSIAQDLMPVAKAMRDILQTIQDMRAEMIDAMSPFFNALGFDLKNANKEMKGGLLDTARKLGERLNDIGLTLLDFAKKNAPEIKEAFLAVYDVFVSVYDLIGNIITELFDVKRENSLTDPLERGLDVIKGTAESVSDYIKGIDAAKIASGIESAVSGVVSFYEGLRDTVNYIKENPLKVALGAVGVAALIKIVKNQFSRGSRFNPMFVKDVSMGKQKGEVSFARDTFNTIKGLFSGPKSGTGLTGTNRIINAIRGGYKGGGFRGALQGAQTAASRMGAGGGRAASLVRGLSSFSGAGATGAGAASGGVVTGMAGGASGMAAGAMAALGPAAIGYAIGQVGKMAFDAAAAKKDAEIKVLDTQLVGAISEAEAARLEELREVAVGQSDELSKGGRIMAGAGTGAAAGALIGSAFFGIGAVPGAAIGAAVGAASVAIYEFSDDVRNSAVMVGMFGEQAGTYSDEFVDNMRKTQQKLLRTQARIDKQKLKNQKTQDRILEASTKNLAKNFKSIVGSFDFNTIKNTDKNFKQFAQQMFDAGNLTEEQFKNAINGVISPMETLETATQGAANRLSNAFTEAEQKAEKEATEAATSARLDTITELGYDPTAALRDIQEATSAAAELSGSILSSGIEAQRNYGGDLDVAEALFVLTGQDSSQAGINSEEMEGIFSAYLQPVITQLEAQGKDPKTAKKLAFESLTITLDDIYKNQGALDLQDEGTQQLITQKLPGILDANLKGTFKGLDDYSLKLLQIEENKEEQITAALTTLAGTQNPNVVVINPSATPQQVQDGSTISNNGPFTIQDSKGNLAVTHPNDKLVVSPNVSYINDGASGKGGPVFPISEEFGALDVKVSKSGVAVQKVKDAMTGVEILNMYPNDTSTYVWNDENLQYINKKGSLAYLADSGRFFNDADDLGILGLSSHSGYQGSLGFATGGFSRFRSILKSYIHDAIHNGNEEALDYVLDPYKPEKIRKLIKNYAPIDPGSYNRPLFYPDNVAVDPDNPNQPTYNKGYRGFDQIIVSDPIEPIQIVEDAVARAERKANKEFRRQRRRDRNIELLDPIDIFEYVEENRLKIEQPMELLGVEPSPVEQSGREKRQARRADRRSNRQARRADRRSDRQARRAERRGEVTPEIQFSQPLAFSVPEPVIESEALQEQVEAKVEYNRLLLENTIPQVEELSLRRGYKAAPTADEVYEEGKLLKYKMQDVGTNTLVRSIQTILKDTYALDENFVDGLYASGSRRYLKQYQTSQGLNSDGVVGGRTYRALFAPDEFAEYLSSHPEVARQTETQRIPERRPSPTPIADIPDFMLSPEAQAEKASLAGNVVGAAAAYATSSDTTGTAVANAMQIRESLGLPNILVNDGLLNYLNKGAEFANMVTEFGLEIANKIYDFVSNPQEWLETIIGEAGGKLTELVARMFMAAPIKEGALTLSKKAASRMPYVGALIEGLIGGYKGYNAIQEYENNPQAPPISELYKELGDIGYETIGAMGGSILGGIALTPFFGPAGPIAGGFVGGILGQILGGILADHFGSEGLGKAITDTFTSTPQQVEDGSALSSKGPFTITDRFGSTAVTAKGDGIVVSPNISYVKDGMTDINSIEDVAVANIPQNTTIVEQDNSALEQEVKDLKQIMSNFVTQINQMSERPVVIQMDGTEVARNTINYMGNNSYRIQ